MAYKNPTLQEIYVRFYLASGTLSQDTFFEVVPVLKKAGFPTVELGQVLSKNPPESSLPVFPRVRCWDADRLKLIQLSNDLITINQVKQYLGWDAFDSLVRDVLPKVESAGIAIEIQSIELHTIDSFSIDKDRYLMGDWINCEGPMIPKWYANSEDACDITLGLGMIDHDKYNRQLHLKVRRSETVNVQFESVFHDDFVKKTSVSDALEDLHKESNAWFEDIITDKVRFDVMGGQV